MLQDMYLVSLSCHILHLVPMILILYRFSDQVIGPYGLLSTKARILVTNSIAFIKQIDQIAYLRRGIIIEQGSYDQLISNEEGALYKLM